MQDLKVALIQRELHWEDPAANRQQFAQDLAALEPGTDLAILPEMSPLEISSIIPPSCCGDTGLSLMS